MPLSPSPEPRAPRRAALQRDLIVAAALALAGSANQMISLKKVWHEGFSPFALEAWLHLLPAELVVALVLVLALSAGHRRLPLAAPGRMVALTLLAAAAVVLGLVLQLLATPIRSGYALPAEFVPYVLQWQLTLVGALLAVQEFSWRRRQAGASLPASSVAREQLATALAQARLQLLQAQVEPHFLFNSLANLRRLVRTDAGAAQAMLADLLRYLQEALPRLRDERCTLASETELVRAYLAVHRVRMGQRLQVVIDVPEALGAAELPSMALLTLVENAIKHGLQPTVAGGTITLRAELQAPGGARELVLSVADTGQGMGSGAGHGTGLANLRARLRALHGPAATLALHVNEPSGVVATIRLPWTL